MRKPGHIFFITIYICLLCYTGNLVPEADAASFMTASESCVAFIKEVEGFSAYPYYDYGQHTVGYGTKCPNEKYFDYLANGIPQKEAEILLQEALADICDAIHKKLIEPYNLSFTQHQFDALVSFSFNLGNSWMTYESLLRNAILRNASDEELVYTFSLYCTAGGNYSSGLVTRRLCEANMFLNGVYDQHASDTYGYVFYDPNGGSLTYRVQGFVCESNTAPMADAVRNGDVFLGWYTDLTDGSRVSELNSTLTGKTLFAKWQSYEEPEFSPMVRVTGDVVNIRKGPGTNYGISKQVYRDNVLVVSHVTQHSNRQWGKVQDGWICLDYTDFGDVSKDTDRNDDVPVPDENPAAKDPQTEPEIHPDHPYTVFGIVRVNDLLRIRSGPGTMYARVGYLPNGSHVEILEQKTAGATVWGRMKQGWISMDYVATDNIQTDDILNPSPNYKQEPEIDQTVTEPTKPIESFVMQGNVKADALRIRSGPGTQHPIVGFYYQNDPVFVSEKTLVQSVYWGKTDKGWINMDYILVASENEDDSLLTENSLKTVIADCLRVRKQIGTDSRIAALLYYGDQVTVLETKTVDGTVWGRVENGWICMDYVN